MLISIHMIKMGAVGILGRWMAKQCMLNLLKIEFLTYLAFYMYNVTPNEILKPECTRPRNMAPPPQKKCSNFVAKTTYVSGNMAKQITIPIYSIV